MTAEIRQAGMQDEIYVNLYGIQSNMMTSINQEFFYLGESLRDPFNVGKNYGPLDIVTMQHDIQEYSGFESPWDPHTIYTGQINNNYTIKSETINLIVPEGLRGLAF